MIIKQETALKVIDKALSTGGDFAEIFLQDTRNSNIGMIDGAVESAVSGRSYGAGIRIFFDEQCIYVYTNDTSEVSLMDSAAQAAAAIKGNPIDLDITINNVKILIITQSLFHHLM